MHHIHQSQPFISQTGVSYAGWPHSEDYSGVSTSTAGNTVPWGHSNYVSAYSVYGGDNTSSYASPPPSYMLPDPETSARPTLSYLCPVSRPQQNSLWLETNQSGSGPHLSSLLSSNYPLTPIESAKSYSTFGIDPGQHQLSHERGITTGSHDAPTLATSLTSIPLPNRDTPPLSAVSHHSSQTWNTDTGSHVSNASSRTSCGENHDSSPTTLTECEDQATIYPFPAGSSNGHLNVSASLLPIASEENVPEQDREPRVSTSAPCLIDTSVGDVLNLRSQLSRDNLRIASPISTLYGYGSTNRSARRSHGLLPTRLLTGACSSPWNKSPICHRNSSLASPQPSESDQFQQHQNPASTLDGTTTY